MKILFVGLPNPGHAIPAGVFVKALEKAGHEVNYHHVFLSDQTPAQLDFWLNRFQLDSVRWEKQIQLLVDQFKPEILVSELPVFSMNFVSKKNHLPWVIFSALPYLFRIFEADLMLQASLPEFEEKEDHKNVRFIGPVVRKAEGRRVEFHKTRPYIHVTQGTVANVEEDLIESCKKALLPDYHLVTDVIEHHLYMEYFDVFITNGGFGGVSQAIYHGVPIICAGETEDKPFVADRVEKSGIGLNLRSAKPTPRLIREAVFKILRDKDMKNRCLEFSALAKERKLEDAVRMLEQCKA